MLKPGDIVTIPDGRRFIVRANVAMMLGLPVKDECVLCHILEGCGTERDHVLNDIEKAAGYPSCFQMLGDNYFEELKDG